MLTAVMPCAVWQNYTMEVATIVFSTSMGSDEHTIISKFATFLSLMRVCRDTPGKLQSIWTDVGSWSDLVESEKHIIVQLLHKKRQLTWNDLFTESPTTCKLHGQKFYCDFCYDYSSCMAFLWVKMLLTRSCTSRRASSKAVALFVVWYRVMALMVVSIARFWTWSGKRTTITGDTIVLANALDGASITSQPIVCLTPVSHWRWSTMSGEIPSASVNMFHIRIVYPSELQKPEGSNQCFVKSTLVWSAWYLSSRQKRKDSCHESETLIIWPS